jgi:hypothetical protein
MGFVIYIASLSCPRQTEPVTKLCLRAEEGVVISCGVRGSLISEQAVLFETGDA